MPCLLQQSGCQTASSPGASGVSMNQDELLALRNLGKTSAQWLHACGIHNADQLRQLGPVNAYLQVRSRGFRASRSLLFAIAGALENIHWTDLSNEERKRLLAQLEQHSQTGSTAP